MSPRLLSLLLLGLAFAVSSLAQNPTNAPARVETALQDLRRDITAAAAELNTLREANTTTRKPIAARHETLEREVRDLREKVRRNRALAQQGAQARESAAQDLARREEELRYLADLASEYRRGMETRMTAVEAATATNVFAEIDTALASDERTGDALARLLSEGVRRAEHRLGGLRLPAVVLDERGVELTGTAVVAGPAVLFATADGARAGWAGTRFGEARPALEEHLPEGSTAAIAALVKGGESVVPLDVTGGDAVKVARSRMSFEDHLRKGGFVMIPLLLSGAVALILALWKFIDLRGLCVRDDSATAALLERIRAGDAAGARTSADRSPEPLRGILREVAAGHRLPRDRLEEILHEHILGFTPRLERHLGTLAVLGGIAPLLGLLGTVTGMIHTFQLVTIFGTGDARLLSGGISEALITTEAGLVIAIPVLLVHALLSRQARGRLAALEQTAIELVNELKAREVS